MPHMILFVLDCSESCPDVLSAWEEAGAPGITILESTGLARIRQATRDDLPLLPSLGNLLSREEFRHRTLFTIVDDEATVERIIAATQRLIGDFSRPHSGLLAVLPVTRVFGLKIHPKKDRPAS